VTTERFAPAAIAAERPDLQPTGERYVELAYTGYAVAAVAPHWRLEVARYLRTLITRAPVAAGPAYAAHREVLGALVVELEALTVRDALDMPSEPADLRDPNIVARERELITATREWASRRQAETTVAYDEHIDRILDGQLAHHDRVAADLQAAAERAQAAVAALPAPEADDAASWLA
jgi:hypothetical protein